jgi:hypothetical protein
VLGRHVNCFDDVASKYTRAVDTIVQSLEPGKYFIIERVHETFVSDIPSSAEHLGGRVDAQDSVFGLAEGLRVDVGDCDARTA